MDPFQAGTGSCIAGIKGMVYQGNIELVSVERKVCDSKSRLDIVIETFINLGHAENRMPFLIQIPTILVGAES
jgi:hypothetical protein